MSKSTEIDRRNFMLAAGTVALAAAVPNVIAADSHHHHGARNKGLGKTSAHCTETGNACVAHCYILLGEGDKKMAECAQSVHLMLAMCNAVGVHAASESKYLKEIVATCKNICEDCEDACRKHEDEHAECKACAESCADMVAECKSYLKAA
jgi:Cys-rich four helix bundle protein (predicted Tat secretion target)